MCTIIIISSCKPDDPEPITPPALVFKFKFDSTQARLNNIGLPASIPSGHAGQSPQFNKISAHYIELAPTMFTALGSGDVLYHAPETSAGGATAINFDQSVKVSEGEVFLRVPYTEISAGNYEYLRVSLSYQNYNVNFQATVPVLGTINAMGTVASFIGYNTYIDCYSIGDSSLCVHDDRLQGYWAFETEFNVSSGQAPAGATTVPNPISATSPIPAGSCVVTAAFTSPLTITGNETTDKTITMSLSTNKSFEWIDTIPNGIWEPLDGESVVDMGIRGLVLTY